jgi:hypothetical protein
MEKMAEEKNLNVLSKHFSLVMAVEGGGGGVEW